MRPGEKEELYDLIRLTMRDHGPKAVAADLGIPYSTLMNELNPHAEAHKLGIERALDVLDLAGGAGPVLDWLCRRYGHVAVAAWRARPAAGELRDVGLRLAEDLGRVSGELRTALAPGGDAGAAISGPELRRIGDAAYALLEDVHRLLAGAEQAAGAGVVRLDQRRRGA